MQNCANCYHWDKKEPSESGRCSGNGPSVALVPQQGMGGPSLAVVTYWPETKDTDRCAKWETKDKWPAGSNTLQSVLKNS